MPETMVSPPGNPLPVRFVEARTRAAVPMP
jgi:hypothetical protein